MLQFTHDDEVYFDLTSKNIPLNEAGNTPKKDITGNLKAPQKNVERPIERLKSPDEATDETTFFDISAEAAAADIFPKPEKNVSTPQFISIPEGLDIPLEIDDDTHEIDVSYFDVAIGGKKDSAPGGAHRTMPVTAVCFPEHSPENESSKDEKSIDSAVHAAEVLSDTDSQAFLGEGIVKGRALDSEDIHRGIPANEAVKIEFVQNASGAAGDAKEASLPDNKENSLEYAAIESIQRAMSESQFFPPGNKNLEEPPPFAPNRPINSLQSDNRSGIRDRVDKAYSTLLNKNSAAPGLHGVQLPKSNREVTFPANKKIGPAPSSENFNPKTPPPKAAHGIETTVFKTSVIETSAAPNYIIFALQGRFDQDQKQFEGFLEQILVLGFHRLICDMSGLISMGSSGWGILIAQLQRLKKHGGNMCLCGMNGEVEQCFRVLELDKLFSFYRSISEAVSTIRQATPKKTKTASDKPDIVSLTLEEKIKRIIAEYPYSSVWQIHKLLRSDAYGKVKISGWALQGKLRSMNLGTKDERYRFFRSA